MNEHDRDRLASALNRLRPDWPIKQLRTLLEHDRLDGRPLRDLAVALTWVACEVSSSSPYRVLESGPWWRAVAVDGEVTHLRDVAPIGSRCTICSLTPDECRSRWGHDHEFARPRERDVDLHPVIAELKGHVQPTRSRPEPAERAHDPRVDEIREALHTDTRAPDGEMEETNR